MSRKSEEDRAVEERIRAHLRQALHERGTSENKLAAKLGVSQSNLNRILNGNRGVGLSLILKIVRGLPIEPVRLLDEDPPRRFFVPKKNPASVKGPKSP
jgi:transcriptional regulator with XRE-family HTH domain